MRIRHNAHERGAGAARAADKERIVVACALGYDSPLAHEQIIAASSGRPRGSLPRWVGLC